jgi:glycosyltransferase involved in cell wall biosynthesis
MDENATTVLHSSTERDEKPVYDGRLSRGDEAVRGEGCEAITLTVLVPTRNEAANVAKLVDDLSRALEGISAEILFVDDSDDSTPATIEAEASRLASTLPIGLLRRERGERAGGLSGAVVAGIRAARGRWVCVMDGDLQHPPTIVPRLLHEAQDQGASLVVASRYCGDGDSSGLSSRGRRVISRSTCALTKSMFPKRLGDISDPMSGFFLFERERVDIDALKPMGFKILLEIATRTKHLRVAEVPFVFAPRNAGTTKAGTSEGVRFAGHLLRLRCATALRRGPRHGHYYDIHGLVCVASERRLPELEDFRVPKLSGADITVQIVALPAAPPTNGGPTGDDPFVFAKRYAEVKNRGFGVDIEVNGKVDVQTTRLVGRSPHVLYTNVVEPILRWRIVEQGYALIHGACLVDGEDAYLITARTDTGKTTTVLKMLDSYPYEFISDDLTLVAPDGTVLPYPKPLTISNHTAHAVKRAQLNWFERAALPLQSRLHSRSGRRFAFLLTKFHLPAASMNAVVQWIIPPPKYRVSRLIPDVRIARKGKLAGMVVIQRGTDAIERLSDDDALEILLANTEDAYGFPPYHAIEEFLLGASGQNLRNHERQIIASALEGVPAALLTREERDWAAQIPGVIDAFASDQSLPGDNPAAGGVSFPQSA